MKTTDELRSILGKDEYDFRFDCGYTKPTNQIEISDRDDFVKSIWLHFTFFLPHAELEQLRKGLRETLQLELVAILHPSELKSFLVASCAFDVTPAYLLDALVVRYSDQGSNKRTEEEAVMVNWSDYIMDLAGDVTLNPFTGRRNLLPCACGP